MHKAGRLISVQDEIVQLKIKYIDSDKSNQLYEISGKKLMFAFLHFQFWSIMEKHPYIDLHQSTHFLQIYTMAI